MPKSLTGAKFSPLRRSYNLLPSWDVGTSLIRSSAVVEVEITDSRQLVTRRLIYSKIRMLVEVSRVLEQFREIDRCKLKAKASQMAWPGLCRLMRVHHWAPPQMVSFVREAPQPPLEAGLCVGNSAGSLSVTQSPSERKFFRAIVSEKNAPSFPSTWIFLRTLDNSRSSRLQVC
jgi:hypothetical protein